MTVVNLTFEEFADRIEDVLDLVDKGDKVFIHHEGKIYIVIPVSDEELASITEKGVTG